MPVSHIGLAVSHIPSATSFYLSALQPLGYRFIGHQGDSIGLGIDSADFFLTQSNHGAHSSPNHIAFLADSRLIVRDCYSAALKAGGLPSGSPDYRNGDCACFNAAVEDLDGNTVEFIFRQPDGEGHTCSQETVESSRLLGERKDLAENAAEEDTQSVAQSTAPGRPTNSKPTVVASRVRAISDLASTVSSRGTKSAASSPNSSRKTSALTESEFPSKALIGVALGAAAGAALILAMKKSESDSARAEANHLDYVYERRRRRHSDDGAHLPMPKLEILPPSAPLAISQAPRSKAKQARRNISVTESALSGRSPPTAASRFMRMIEAPGHHEDDADVQEALRPTRSRTDGDQTYLSASKAPPPSAAPTRQSSKHAPSVVVNDEDRSGLHDEAVAAAAKSSVSRRSSRTDAAPQESASQASRRRSCRKTAPNPGLKRHDSGICAPTARSYRENEHESLSEPRSSASRARKAKSPREYEDRQAAAGEVTNMIPLVSGSRAPSTCYFPAAIPLPASKAPSTIEQRIPYELLNPSKQSWEDFVPEEDSDGLEEVKTVRPEDSISVADLPLRRRRRVHGHGQRHHHSRSHRHDSKLGLSDYSTVNASQK